ncbi:phosphoribosyltransferase [Phototrophicus methaneseepsis]|uniref:Phosphoribosyltransferase n=1 Tax=Phototrophicus methaneseepsis TaxID=2710758 RepID=A0A7S8EAD6_9CHLR|nr:phosphoribosyltransferase [Phototrophicus methaneseepsis]QPC83328.1 phosphoribosyltransferase [Phototrophicus methaneseepsis]
MRFQNRSEAGKFLAEKLVAYRDEPNVLILALPRGGVPVAVEVANVLHAPMDLFLVRKLGVPGRDELAMGAVATGGIRVLNSSVIKNLEVTQAQIEAVTAREKEELARREQAYRDDQPPPRIQDRTIILIDDGLATGATMRAAVQALRQQQPSRLVVGVPVASPQTCAELQELVDEIVCAITPDQFNAIGTWYEDFSQLTDDDVRDLMIDGEQI